MSFLYVVGTPIGNLSDFSPRGREVLGSVDFIAAEDTRVTLKLLTHFGIQKPLVSYHEHNIREKGEAIVTRILNGESCAVVTDAGMPCISDPGEDLVRLCAERGIEIRVVPSPTAAMSALAVSGLSTARFAFEGFLSVNQKQRRERLEELRSDPRTLIFYEAPHKLRNTLADLLDFFGDRRIALCRELTKIHEEVLRGTVSDMIAYYKERVPRGEYVLIVSGAEKPKARESMRLAEACALAKEKIDAGMKPADACKEAARQSGFAKSEIYAKIVEA